MKREEKPRRARFMLAALLSAAVGVQGFFIVSYPQPQLFGDPAGYLEVGRNIFQALGAVRQGQGIRANFVKIRGSLYFAAAGIFYGAVDWLWRGNVQAIRWTLLIVNILGFLGLYVLTRRLTDGSEGAALGAVCLAILHPSFSTHLGRAYPDPLTACFFVWSAALFVVGIQANRVSALRGAVFLLSCGLLVRPQILGPVVLVIAVVCAGVTLALPQHRRTVAKAATGLIPAAILWGAFQCALVVTANEKGKADDFAGRYGWVVFNQEYPQGFWQYLDTDGWEGPYRLRQEPFYKALEAAAVDDPALLTSSAKGYLFAARYAMRDPLASLLMMLDNAYRIFARPVNPYRWDYPIPLGAQVFLHRLILLCALVQFAYLASRSPALLPIFVIPVSLATIHAFTFPWPRYSQSSLLIVIAAASAFLFHAGRAASLKRPLLAVGTLLLVWFAVPSSASTTIGHVASLLVYFALVVTPFVLIARSGSTRWARLAPLVLCPLLLAPAVAHTLRDRSWHERSATLGANTVVKQDIQLTPEAASELAAASESFVVLDLRTPAGRPRSLQMEINGTAISSDALVPAMPNLPESTTMGGRDPQTYRQWWAIPLSKELLKGRPDTAGVSVTVRASASEGIELYGDRFADEGTVYEGPSFGEHPNSVALKLEYDGDYRIPKRYTLGSMRTTSTIKKDGGAEEAAPMTFRIRVVSIAGNTGGMTVEGEAPTRPAASWAFFAFHGPRGSAELTVDDGEPVSFPLGQTQGFTRESNGTRICFRPRPESEGLPYGAFVVSTSSAVSNRPPVFKVSFKTGMSVEPMLFFLDRKASSADLTTLFDECDVPSGVERHRASRLIDGSRNSYPSDTGRWRVDKVY